MPNVLSPRDLVFRPDNMDEIVPHTAAHIGYEPCHKKTYFGVSTRSDTKWAVLPQKMARGLKFLI